MRYVAFFFLSLLFLPLYAEFMEPVWEVKGNFNRPYGVCYHPRERGYLVSNIGGSDLDKDGNGTISLFTYDNGEVIERTLFRSSENESGYKLHAPKGMCVLWDKVGSGDNAKAVPQLYVADIDEIKVFNLIDERFITSIPLPRAQDLTDIFVDTRRNMYAMDRRRNYIYRLVRPFNRNSAVVLLAGYTKSPSAGTFVPSKQKLFVTSAHTQYIYEVDPIRRRLLKSWDLRLEGLNGICQPDRKEMVLVASSSRTGYLYEIEFNRDTLDKSNKTWLNSTVTWKQLNRTPLKSPGRLNFIRETGLMLVTDTASHSVAAYNYRAYLDKKKAKSEQK